MTVVSRVSLKPPALSTRMLELLLGFHSWKQGLPLPHKTIPFLKSCVREIDVYDVNISSFYCSPYTSFLGVASQESGWVSFSL